MNEMISSYGSGSSRITQEEYTDNFLRYCTLVCVLNNKKLNLANIFILTLKNKYLRSIYKELCDITNDYEGLKKFLEYDITLHKSKYIKKFLNNNSVKLK